MPKLVRYLLPLSLGMAILGFATCAWAEANAAPSYVPTVKQPVAIQFHSDIVWVDQRTATLYHRGLRLFLVCWAACVCLIIGGKVFGLDSNDKSDDLG
jgi:hypothetical protein